MNSDTQHLAWNDGFGYYKPEFSSHTSFTFQGAFFEESVDFVVVKGGDPETAYEDTLWEDKHALWALHTYHDSERYTTWHDSRESAQAHAEVVLSNILNDSLDSPDGTRTR